MAMATDALEPSPLPGGIVELIRISTSRYGTFNCFIVCFIVCTIPDNAFGASSAEPWNKSLSIYTGPLLYFVTAFTPISGKGTEIAGCHEQLHALLLKSIYYGLHLLHSFLIKIFFLHSFHILFH